MHYTCACILLDPILTFFKEWAARNDIPLYRVYLRSNFAMDYDRKARGREDNRRRMRRQTQEEPEIIKVPDFDYSNLIEKHKLSLVGRMFHKDG